MQLGIDDLEPHRHSIFMKNSQSTLSKSMAVSFSAAIVATALLAPQAPAAYPVTDAGVIAQLKVLNTTAKAIEGQAIAINQSSATTARNTTQIMSDTAQINQTTLATLPKIQQDIQTMREIGVARQNLTYRIAQLTELTLKGNAFKEDAFALAVAQTGIPVSVSGADSMDQILREMGEYIKEPWDLSGDPGIRRTTQDQMKQNSFDAGADLSYKFDNVDTLITPKEAGIDEVLGELESFYNLSWGGNQASGKIGFTGMNADYMRAMVSHGGRVIALDYVPPVTSISLSETQKSRLKKLRSSALNDILRNHIRENYRRATQAGENPWEIAPGVFVRPKTEADVLFEKMVISEDATPATELAFYAAASSYSKTQYDPYWGFSEKAEFSLPVNMNDVLSRGAYGAIQRYNREHGIPETENPYGNFGKAIAPLLVEIVNRTSPGCNLVITEGDMERASQIDGYSLKGVPGTSQEWEEMFARSKQTQDQYIRVAQAAAGADKPSEEVVVYFGLNKRDTKIYNSKIIANSTRLSQNNKTLLTQVCLLNYNKKALKEVIALETALHNLTMSTSEQNIVEMLPMLRDSVQNTIMVLQNRIGQQQAQIDSLLKDRYETLATRQGIVEEYRQVIVDESKGQVERIMMSTAPTTLNM